MASMATSPQQANGYQQGPPHMMGNGPQMNGPPHINGSQANGPQMNSPPRGANIANIINPKSHVGFDSITSQIERKLLKRGFQFNVICVGMFVAAAAIWSHRY
jgi:hypothetical protein